MDVTAPKSSHVIDSIVAAAKGGDNNDGSGEQAISFSNVLKANGNLFKSGAKNGSLDSILSRNSGQSDTQETDTTPTQEGRDEIHQTRRDDGYDDNATNDRRDERQASAAPDQNNDAHQNHAENAPVDAAPHRESPAETHNDTAQPANDAPIAASAQNGDGEQPQTQNHSAVEKSSNAAPNIQNIADAAPNAANTDADGDLSAALHGQAHNGAEQTNNAARVATVAQDAKGDKPLATASQAAVAAPTHQQGKAEAKNAAEPAAKTVNADSTLGTDESQNRGSQKAPAQAQAKGQNTHTQAQNQPTVGAEMQAAKQAQNNAKMQESSTPTQQQAQELSKRLDPGTSMEVNVSVDDKSAQLTSRPSASLAQASNKGATATGAQAQSANAQQGPAANAAAQNPAVNIQAQGAAPAQPGQAATPGAAAQAATAGATATAGVDGASSANNAGQAANTSQSTFAQQAQAASKQEAAKPQQTQNQHQRAAVDQVSVQITKAMKAGADIIRIQMKPAALGRVDVHLEVSDGRVTATVYADNKETLEMLQRGSRDLARALNSAGLHADSDNLNFNLREQGGQHQQANHSSRGHNTANAAEAASADAAPTPDLPQYQGIRADGRIDIHA